MNTTHPARRGAPCRASTTLKAGPGAIARSSEHDPCYRADDAPLSFDEPDEGTTMPDPSEPLLTPRELAEYLRVSERTIRRWCAGGRIKAIRYGRTVRFRLSDIAPD